MAEVPGFDVEKQNRLYLVTDLKEYKKGMITVIAETGVNTKGLNTEKMRQILQQYQVQR